MVNIVGDNGVASTSHTESFGIEKYDKLGIIHTTACSSLTINKILELTKLKALADKKFSVIQRFEFALHRVENIVGKGENAGYQHFLLSLQCFQKSFYLGSLKVGIVW